jgi:predicted secreted protein
MYQRVYWCIFLEWRTVFMNLPVPIPMAIAIYFTIWWIALFAILPFGVRSQAEAGEIMEGTEPGAPTAPRLLQKALWTSVLASIVFIALMLWIANGT